MTIGSYTTIRHPRVDRYTVSFSRHTDLEMLNSSMYLALKKFSWRRMAGGLSKYYTAGYHVQSMPRLRSVLLTH